MCVSVREDSLKDELVFYFGKLLNYSVKETAFYCQVMISFALLFFFSNRLDFIHFTPPQNFPHFLKNFNKEYFVVSFLNCEAACLGLASPAHGHAHYPMPPRGRWAKILTCCGRGCGCSRLHCTNFLTKPR